MFNVPDAHTISIHRQPNVHAPLLTSTPGSGRAMPVRG